MSKEGDKEMGREEFYLDRNSNNPTVNCLTKSLKYISV